MTFIAKLRAKKSKKPDKKETILPGVVGEVLKRG